MSWAEDLNDKLDAKYAWHNAMSDWWFDRPWAVAILTFLTFYVMFLLVSRPTIWWIPIPGSAFIGLMVSLMAADAARKRRLRRSTQAISQASNSEE